MTPLPDKVPIDDDALGHAASESAAESAKDDAKPPRISIVTSPTANSGRPKTSVPTNTASSAKGANSTNPRGSTTAAAAQRDPSAPPVRRERSWWMKHPNITLAAAIIAGAMAAVIISRIVLWIVNPAVNH